MTASNEERDVVESYRLGVNTVAKIGLYWVLSNRVSQGT